VYHAGPKHANGFGLRRSRIKIGQRGDAALLPSVIGFHRRQKARKTSFDGIFEKGQAFCV
jgi:hypothetical protein